MSSNIFASMIDGSSLASTTASAAWFFSVIGSRFSCLWFPRSAFEMPLSEDQISALKHGATSISIQMENPPKNGSKAWEKFEKYKHVTTIAEAMGNSANWKDVSRDFEKGYMSRVEPAVPKAAPLGRRKTTTANLIQLSLLRLRKFNKRIHM